MNNMMSSIEKKIMKQGGPGVFEKKIAELTQLENDLASPGIRNTAGTEPGVI